MLNISWFERVTEFINSLPEAERLKIGKVVEAIQAGEFESLHIKTIKGPIKELIVHKTRILFCIEKSTLYYLNAFTKKSAKTPRSEIRFAEYIYRLLFNKNNLSS
ncbi:MAG: type II toxin-antitoxin system RelE/ParE family toxin [Patescibacteria group bacterium]